MSKETHTMQISNTTPARVQEGIPMLVKKPGKTIYKCEFISVIPAQKP